ncbi:hypothetical protein N1F89_01510 [Aquibium sp. A9E412]|uniref:hypothetical protein n=1 Tax=Aquibium sp. A9E412 TaxID=2976767 RepID=UPI0025B144B5|nr:hypothetical protein [Aquibium sp. A9E412]MDN2564886.1 hypothetical protein [Aquibium sp. A9E412]
MTRPIAAIAPLAAQALVLALAGGAHAQEAQPKTDGCRADHVRVMAWAASTDSREIAEVIDEIELRRGPSASCEGFYLVPAAGTVEVIGCANDWCGVSYGTRTGYLPAVALDDMPNRAPPLPES